MNDEWRKLSNENWVIKKKKPNKALVSAAVRMALANHVSATFALYFVFILFF